MPYSRRSHLFLYEDPMRNDIQLLSFYINKFKQEKAMSGGAPAIEQSKANKQPDEEAEKEMQKMREARAARMDFLEQQAKQERHIDTSRETAASPKKQRIEEQRTMEEQEKKREEERRNEKEKRREEERRLAEERAGEEEARRKAQAKKEEAERKAEQARQEELAAKAAAERAAKLEMQAERLRQEELAKQAELEQMRKDEEERLRLEEEKRIQEELKAEEERKQLARLEELAKQAEEEREAELARQAEELAEIARQEAQLAEQAKREADEAELRRQEEELAELERQEAELAELERKEKELAEQASREAEAAKQEAELAELAKQEAELAELERQQAELDALEAEAKALEADFAGDKAEQVEDGGREAELTEEEAELAELERQQAALDALEAEAKALDADFESWIIHDPSVLTICGYRLLYNQGDINQNDGVLVYVRDSLSFQYGVTYISEVKAIVITLKYTTTNIKITALYRPPSTCPNKFIDSLTQYLDQQRQNDCETHFIIGDMNINIQECNATTNSYLNMMSTYGFKSYINGFTRVQGQIKSCIDHIFIKDLQSRYEYKSFILENDLTDHYPIIVQAIPFTEGKVQIKNKSIRQFVDNKKLVTEIEKETWLDIYACDSAELATNFFISKIQNAIRKSTNRIKIAHENRKRTPWITEKIIKMIQKGGSDSNAIWKAINRLTEKRGQTKEIDQIKINEATTLNEPKEIAEYFCPEKAEKDNADERQAELAKQEAELEEIARQEAELADLERQQAELDALEAEAKALEADFGEPTTEEQPAVDEVAQSEAATEDEDDEDARKQREMDELIQQKFELAELERQQAELDALEAEAKAMAEPHNNSDDFDEPAIAEDTPVESEAEE
nr:unnamed protein product [Callosobruchus analis]